MYSVNNRRFDVYFQIVKKIHKTLKEEAHEKEIDKQCFMCDAGVIHADGLRWRII